MATAKKLDPIEDVHFRIDEAERKIAELGTATSPEVLQGMLRGLLTALKAERDAEREAHDAKLEAVLAKLEVVLKDNEALREFMMKPTTRTGTVELPGGPVTMTITEKR